MIKKHKNVGLLFFLLLMVVIFVCLNVSTRLIGGNLKIDMTQSQRYSLSDASKEILSSLTMPVQIRLYISSNLATENPQYASYAQFVLRYLKKYQQAAKPDIIKIETLDPQPYSPLEEEAKRQGIKPLPDSGGKSNLYFGAVITNAKGQKAVIPNFISARSGYLETDISRILYKLNNSSKPKLGLVSPQLPLITHAYGQIIPNWAIVAQLQNDYEIIELKDNIVQIPGNIDVLLVINIEKLSPLFTYALDQFVLRGGKLLIITDAFSERQASTHGQNSAPTANLNALLQNWGLNVNNEIIAGDRTLGEITSIQTPQGTKAANFPYWLHLSKSEINQQHPATKGLDNIVVKTSGIISPQKDLGQTKYTPLLTTTAKGGNIAAKDLYAHNQAELDNLFNETSQQYTLAAEIEGKFPSLFNTNILAGTKFAKAMPSFLSYSIAPSKIIVIADSDFIVAENWADTSQTQNNPVYGLAPIYDNGSFLLRLLDYLTNRTTILGLSNKENFNTKSIGEELYMQTFNQYAAAYNKAQAELIQRLQLAKNYETQISQRLYPLTAQRAKEIEENNKAIQSLQLKLKQIEYQIKEQNQQKISSITQKNIIYFPLTCIILILLCYMYLKSRQKKKIEEWVHEARTH